MGALDCISSKPRLTLIIRAVHYWLPPHIVQSVLSVHSESTLLCIQPAVHLLFTSGCHLTRAKVTGVPCTLLQHLGFPTELYVSHSFRINTATSAAEAGLPPWLIQTLQRWSSNCFTIYIRTLPSVLQKVPSHSAATNTSGQWAWTPLQGHYTSSFP